MEQEIKKTSPMYETYYNAIATPTVIRKKTPKGMISGCLYSSEGKIIPLSQRYGGYYGDMFLSEDADSIHYDDFVVNATIQGKCIYLGHFMPHYGHFLVEMLSSFWMHDTFKEYDYFIFHPFVFKYSFPPYIKEAFDAFGIQQERIIIIKGFTKIEQVTIPERLIKLNKDANIKMKNVYDFIVRSFAVVCYPPHRKMGKKMYYFCRVPTSIKKGYRTVLNEPFIEDFLNRIEFKTVYPERLSFREQVSIIHNADVICGLSGSALHNCVFMKEKSICIEIADARCVDDIHPMQNICNKLSKSSCYFIPFSGYIINNKGICYLNKKIFIQIIKILSDNNVLSDVDYQKSNNYWFKVKIFILLFSSILHSIRWMLSNILAYCKK